MDFGGCLVQKGSGSTVSRRQDSEKDPLVSSDLEGSLYINEGEIQSATRHCTRLTTMNLIEHHQASSHFCISVGSLIALINGNILNLHYHNQTISI